MPHKDTKKRKLYLKEWAQRHRDQHRNLLLKKRYGITLEQFQALTVSQKGQCAICQRVQLLTVDHCHRTGSIRGLLCRYCNSRIGFLENTALLARARDYLASPPFISRI
jgi:hypothetical protein